MPHENSAANAFRVDLSQAAVKNVITKGLPHTKAMVVDAVRRADPNLMPPITPTGLRQKVAVCIHVPAAMGETASDPLLLTASWEQFRPADTGDDVVMADAVPPKAGKKKSTKVHVLPLVSSRGHMTTEIAHDEIKLLLGKLRKVRVEALVRAGQSTQANRFCTELNALLQAIRARSNVLVMECAPGTVAPGFFAPPLPGPPKPPLRLILYGTGGANTESIVVADDELEFIKCVQKYLHPIRFIRRHENLAAFREATEHLLFSVQRGVALFSGRQ